METDAPRQAVDRDSRRADHFRQRATTGAQQYGDNVSAITMKIPHAASIVACIDGYQMTLKGKTGVALFTAAVSSFIGGTVAIIVLAWLAPVLSEVALLFGPVEYSGVGGQLDFQIGALLSKGGRALTVLPSTAQKGKVSRIQALFPEGQIVTVPRTFADFIVTEYGVASLQGKTQRQRAASLIEVAHPDFRDQLRSEAKRLYG